MVDDGQYRVVSDLYFTKITTLSKGQNRFEVGWGVRKRKGDQKSRKAMMNAWTKIVAAGSQQAIVLKMNLEAEVTGVCS